jgi:RimJ/RimL family protein N-acetyltransferase
MLTEDAWRVYRDVRLAALIDSPRAFWATYAEAATRTDEQWRERASSIGATWLAFDGERPVGTVGLWHADDQPEDEVYLVGMWVATVARGSDVATRLVEVALAHAAASGRRRVVLDVAHENQRAWAFYLRMGFRPTGQVETMPWDSTVTEEAMVLELPVGG